MAKDLEYNRLVAVKRVMNPFCKGERAKCSFRELHLLRSLHHPNVPVVRLSSNINHTF